MSVLILTSVLTLTSVVTDECGDLDLATPRNALILTCVVIPTSVLALTSVV